MLSNYRHPLLFLSPDPISPTAALPTVDIHVRGGGTEQYGGYNSTTGVYDNGDRWGASTLTRVTANSYERVFRDGSKEVYATSNGATVAPRKIFLTEVRDPFGNALTLSYTGGKWGQAIKKK